MPLANPAVQLQAARSVPRTARARSYGEVLEQVHSAAVWIPLYHEPMKIGYSAKLAPIKAHNIYGCGLYKGLDLKFAAK
jgi:peptide/nickel transport system substrate-binding protein